MIQEIENTMLKKLQYKRVFATLRKYAKMIFITETEFDKHYYETRVRDTVEEVLSMPLSKRFTYMKSIHEKVLTKTLVERAAMATKLQELDNILENVKNNGI